MAAAPCADAVGPERRRRSLRVCAEQPRPEGARAGRLGQQAATSRAHFLRAVRRVDGEERLALCSCSSTAASAGRACRARNVVHMRCTCGAQAVHRQCTCGGALALHTASFTSGSSVQHCVASCSSGWGSTRASRRRVARPRPGTRAASVGTRRGGRPHILRRLAVRSQSGLTGLDAPRGG